MKTELSFVFIFGAVLVCTNANISRLHDIKTRGGFVDQPNVDDLDQLTLAKEKEYWITQRLNHFDHSDSRTWKQRYQVVNSYFNKTRGGPLFVQIGGEGPGTSSAIAVHSVGDWITYAKEFGALCLLAEHRYYGLSRPTADLRTENLKYLSSEQALEDLAVLVTDVRRKYNFTKTIVFGGSYAGNLAAWFRVKYPHIADGVISMSGPLLAKLDFHQFLEVVDQSLKTYDGTTKCADNIQTATASIVQLMKSSSGRDKVASLFNLCENVDLTEFKTVVTFYVFLAEGVMGAVQGDSTTGRFDLGRRTRPMKELGLDNEIGSVCRIMNDETRGSPIQRLADYNNGDPSTCNNVTYDGLISNLRSTKYRLFPGGRPWYYQKCTEFGYFKTTNSKKQPFQTSIPLQYFMDVCKDVFSPAFNLTLVSNAIRATNDNYGGLDIQLTKAVFFNGGLDPWHALGIDTPTHMEDVHTFYVEGVSHCALMNPPHASDPPALTKARQKIGEIIQGWLGLGD